ncbi:MAG: hypothetical protein QXZ57_06980 [Nitrososphaerota archaeon]
MGKDFAAAYIALSFFLCPQMYFQQSYVDGIERNRLALERSRGARLSDLMVHTRRIVTTSVDERHLGTLWGEISRYLVSCSVPLLESHGGPLVVNHMDIRFKEERESKQPLNWLIGRTAENKEAFQGYHAEYTLFLADEVSGIRDEIISMAQTWAKKEVLFGNPRPCSNEFYRAVKRGDIAV